MNKSIVSEVERALGIDASEIGRRLGVSIGTVKRWRKSPPAYAVYALTALAVGADPRTVFPECDSIEPLPSNSRK